MGNLQSIADAYRKKYNSEPLIVRSPGRVNLIGEHTDYNLGSVLPGAIDKYIYFAVGTRTDDDINIDAADYSDQFTASLTKLEPAWKLWPNYILGVISEFQKAGKYLSGMNIVFGGDIPLSAGMSSSAAISSATAFALNKVFNSGYSKVELARIAVAAEHNYLGVKCGIMDQYVNLFGKESHLVRLDCRTEQHEYIPFNAGNIRIVLFDSGVRHNLVKLTAAFNALRTQCQTGLELVKKHVPDVAALPDITESMLMQFVKPVDELAYKRCLYIVQEENRLKSICADLKKEDFVSVGQRMFENHYGLRDLYEVSCNECDFLVDTARQTHGVLGSRMMGAGFGGCTINLVYSDMIEDVIDKLKTAYKSNFNKDLKVYMASIGNGTEVVTAESLVQ